MNRKTLSLLVAALLAATAAHADDPARLVLVLRNSLKSVTDFTARFTQKTTMEAAGMDRVSSGRVAFKRGAKVKWEYEGSDPQVIVSDGKVLWIHQVRDKTAIRRELAELTPAARAALDILGGVDQVEKMFTLVSCGTDCVEMNPNTPDPDLASIKLELADGATTIRAIVTEDPVGNRTRIELSMIEKNKGVPDKTFEFTPPKGIDVFDGQGRAR